MQNSKIHLTVIHSIYIENIYTYIIYNMYIIDVIYVIAGKSFMKQMSKVYF